jgi:hypothetical protein
VSSRQDQGLVVSRQRCVPSTRKDTDAILVLVVLVAVHLKVPDSVSPALTFCLTFQPPLCPEAGAARTSSVTNMSKSARISAMDHPPGRFVPLLAAGGRLLATA